MNAESLYRISLKMV